MYKNNLLLSIYKDINFITVVILYLINNKKIKNIKSVYYLKYNFNNSNTKKIKKIKENITNYYISFNYNFINNDDKILLTDKIFILSHITLLRNISREKTDCWHIISDNQKNNNLDTILNNPLIKFIKCFQIVSYKSQKKYINFYIINKLSAKILIIAYIMCINKIYAP